ncbi:FAD-binding oxidoreductase, partial [bacterium]|nr:FAD-binding oxidoreductase [bacterium]
MNATSTVFAPRPELLSGWGGHPLLPCNVWSPRNTADLQQLEQLPDIIPRGEGRSYGDPSIICDGNVILMSGLNRLLAFDPDQGLLQCQAGVTLADIQDKFIPQGWMLPVTPGTRFVQVGGAIAADVHGKNHHRTGAFSNWIREITLLHPDGRMLTCNQQVNREQLLATAGGMGLTGIILTATLQMKRITVARIRQRQTRVKSLEEMLSLLAAEDEQHEYSVAWLDCTATGNSWGRGVVFFGDDAQLNDLNEHQRLEPLQLRHPRELNLPWRMPSRLLSPAVIHAFNSLYWRTHSDREGLVDLYTFFYPLDSLRNWNRIYGKAGFTQYQFILPEQRCESGVADVLEQVSHYRGGSSLAVLKRMGAGNGLLSFPLPGITVALDFPLRPGLFDLLTKLDDIVIQNQGRVYLAKDMRLSPRHLEEMYHEL